jgi:hypothetical protein
VIALWWEVSFFKIISLLLTNRWNGRW